jgi:hypothetical protein
LWEWIHAFEDLQAKSTQLVHDMFDILRGILLILNKILTFQNWLFIHIRLIFSQIDQILIFWIIFQNWGCLSWNLHMHYKIYPTETIVRT